MERCKCGRPVSRVTFGVPEIAEFEDEKGDCFSVFRKSRPHEDGMCSGCRQNGYVGIKMSLRGAMLKYDMVDHLEEIKHNYTMYISRQL